jgi:mycobactin lysine-N-oxygenase
MATQQLAIVGLGPKGAAIAAKATALKNTGRDAPDITVFDPDGVAPAWSGKFGYTDGEQELCTLAERDIGYPYDRGYPGVSDEMFANFSWQSFAISEGSGGARYDEWVTRGRRPPLHRQFARYLEFVVRRCLLHRVHEEVTRIEFNPDTKRWIVFTKNGPHPLLFDGVVITGSGKPYRALPNANQRVFNGRTFWQNLPAVSRLLSDAGEVDPQDRSVLIFGGGGTAAAVALWFARSGLRRIPIHIIGHEATLYARNSSYFEDRLFSDSDEWKALAPHIRDAFVSRLARGVVWNSVLESLARSETVTYRSYSARGFRVIPSLVRGQPDDLWLEADFPSSDRLVLPVLPRNAVRPSPPGYPAEILPATVFVDARGFDPWWFAEDLLLQKPFQDFFGFASEFEVRRAVSEYLDIGQDTPKSRSFPPGLHVPMVASHQGPGAPNLMALGWMSDQILQRYL